MQDPQTKLLERVIGQDWHVDTQVDWTIGTVPESPDPVPPMLEGTRVIGAIQRQEKPGKAKVQTRGMGMNRVGFNLTLYLEIDGLLEEIKSAYTGLLEQEGWAKMPLMHSGGGGGFQSDFFQHYLEFRFGETLRGANLSFQQHAETVWVTMNLLDLSPEMLEHRSRRHNPWEEQLKLPQLNALPATNITFGGGGSSGNEQHSSAYIDSELSLEAIGQAFTAQISEQGFTVLETVSLERTFVATFHKLEEKGDVWGSLTLQTMEEQLYSALLTASRASNV